MISGQAEGSTSMIEVLHFIFRDGWTFFGMLLILSLLTKLRAFEINNYYNADKEDDINWRERT